MKIQIGNVMEDWREDCCARCGLSCNPHYRICYQLDKRGRYGNQIIDEEFTLCRFCLPKVVGSWGNMMDEEPAELQQIQSPNKEEWKEVNEEIKNEND